MLLGMDTPRKKPGRPLRFPERVLVYVTADTKADLEKMAADQMIQVADVVRQMIRDGLERAKQADQ